MTEDEPRRSRRSKAQVQRYAEEDLSEEDEVATTAQGKSSKAHRPRSKRQNGRQELQTIEQKMDSPLFDGVLDHETSLESLAADWIDEYQKDPIGALTVLLNFTLKSSGCEIPVERHDVENFESGDGTILQVQQAAMKYIPADYPIVSKQKEFRGFAKQLRLFFEHLTLNASERGIMYEDQDFMARGVVGWITLVSASPLRAFRHTATVILLHIMNVLCDVQRDLVNEKNEQLAIATKRKVTKQAATLAKEMVTTLDQRIAVVDQLLKDIFESVFATRVKDVDAHIRTECIELLGELLEEFPNKFMENTYLKHFAFALSDPAASTRLAALKALKPVYQKVNLMTAFRRFTERYQARMVDLAEYDADHNVRKSAVDLLVLIQEKEALTEENASRVSELIMDRDSHVRREAAKFLAKKAADDDYSAEFEDMDEDDLGDFLEAHDSSVKLCFVQFKRMAHMLANFDQARPDRTDSHAKPSDVLVQLQPDASILPSRIANGAAALYNVTRRAAEWHWFELVQQLLLDFSALEMPENARRAKFTNFIKALEPTEDEKPALYDMLYGFVVSAMEHAADPRRANGKRREQEEIESALLDLQNELISRVPELVERVRYSPTLLSKALRLANLIDPQVYVSQEKEKQQLDSFKLYIKQFLTQTDRDVLVTCREIIGSALDSRFAISEVARTEVYALLEDIVYDIRLKYGAKEVDYDDGLVSPLSKLEQLAMVIDITGILERNLGEGSDKGDTLVNVLLESIPSPERSDEYVIVAGGILRSYAIWKVGFCVSGEGSAAERDPLTDRDVIESIITQLQVASVFPELSGTEKQRKKILRDQNNKRQTHLKTALLEVMAALYLARKHSQLTAYGESVLDNIDLSLPEETAKEIMALYLEKEEAWAIEAGVTIHEDELDEQIRRNDDVMRDEDEDEVDDEEQEDDTSGNGDPQDEEVLDADLCLFTAKVNLAIACDIISPNYAPRLKFNAHNLSAQYNKVMAAIFKQPANGSAPKRKRA